MSNLLSGCLSQRFSNLTAFINTIHHRSITLALNIFASVLLRGVNMIASFAMVPVMLNYLNPNRYGIWLTLNSIVTYFGLMDIGLGVGLRNRLTEALARQDNSLARAYISTAYITFSVLLIPTYAIVIGAAYYIRWDAVLNAPHEMAKELYHLFIIVFSFFSINYFLRLISAILIADQKQALANALDTVSNILSLTLVYALLKGSAGSIIWASVALYCPSTVVFALATLALFAARYGKIAPSLRRFDMSLVKSIMALSGRFFVVQVSFMIIFSTDNLIITQLFGPSEVTLYNISLKYFSVVTVLFAIITSPLWPAFTQAYHVGDYKWIESTTRRLRQTWVLSTAIVLLLVVVSPIMYRFWLRDNISVPISLSISVGLFVILNTFTNIYIVFINAVGKIQLQLYVGVCTALINIPLSILLGKYLLLGSKGVILATCICLAPCVCLWPIQYRKIMTNSARGIWAR